MSVSSLANHVDTIVAVSSPPGPAYRAVIRISGIETRRIVAAVSSRAGEDLPERRRLLYVNMRIKNFEMPATVLWMPGPKSFTGEDVAELHFSGSETLQLIVLKELIAQGARLARAGEYTERAFLNGRIDLSRAEAVMSAINSNTREEVKAAAAQLSGAFGEAVRDIRQDILRILADVELNLDFTEHDIPAFELEEILQDLHLVQKKSQKLLNCSSVANIETRPLIAICGKPGVGKSSLFNRLLGQDKSIVHEIPGTTRDVIETEWSAVTDGAGYLLADTPSMLQDDDEIYKAALHSLGEIIRRADAVIWIETDPAEALDFGESVSFSGPVLRLGRKVALELSPEKITAMVQSGLDTTEASKFILNVRQQNVLGEVVAAIKNAITLARESRGEELIAEELRSALMSVSELVGGDVTAEVLENIFSNFCLGK